MCGRFVQYSDPEIYASEFNLDTLCEATPRYNVAPTQPVLANRQSCELPCLVSSVSRLALTCPFCVLHPRRGGRGEPRLVLAAGLGAPSAVADIDALLTPPGEDR